MSVSISSGYQPYTGVINTNSKRYKAAKKMYDEGHANQAKSPAEEKAEEEIAKLKMLKEMLGQKFDENDFCFKNLFEADEETYIRNYMGLFDEDGDLLNAYGVAGMDITGKDPSEWHNIVDIPETAKQDMFDETMRHFIQENGVANGDTTKRTEVFTRYQLSVPKDERLEGTWTLEQYERMYRKAFSEAVRESDPTWELGKPFNTAVVRSITREDVENRIVKGDTELALMPKNSLDVTA